VNPETLRYWRRILVGNLIASAVVLFAFSGVTWRTRVPEMVRSYAIALLFSTCIAPFVGAVMPRLAPWIWQRTRFPFNWIVITIAMAGMAIVGSLAAIAVLIAIGTIPAADFANWFRGSIRIAIVVTLTIGLFITAYEMTKARIAEATAQAQLASLESRVQPHFLFNTLNSIAALIHEDPKGAERMTGQLASLMRTSLDQGAKPLVSLDDELKTVRDYLAIEHVRFGDRLRYRIDIDESAKPAHVPRLSIQTLVENSVKYAVSPRREGASITITARQSSMDRSPLRMVVVTVEDDGPGFDVTAIPAGHGLALLRDRIGLLFKRFPLRIDSAPGRTAVTMTVPEVQLHDKPPLFATAGVTR
jgi:two-component system, LytTR family, sensor histidine kinase AlgZ